MTTKQCFKCKKIFTLDMFYKHPEMPDGRVNKCKECNKKDVRDNRAIRIDYYKEYDKNRANNPNRVNARNEYSKTENGKNSHKKACIAWKSLNIVKRSAQILVGNAVRDNKLIKPKECCSCGISNTIIHGHHCDYAKPLDVMWLCPKCHSKWHKEHTPINGD